MPERVDEPGIYDDLCTRARIETQAQGVVVVVIKGNLGSGFSVQVEDESQIPLLADIFEDIAGQIRLNYIHAHDEVYT